jgi:putative intracellular protease/amidase
MFEGFREEMIPGAGADIFVRHGGKVDGPGLLLLHGYPQTSAMWHDDRLPLVEMKTLTGFTNLEEAAVGLTEVVPFLLQSKLEEGGASFSNGGVFSEHIVVDGLLVTGQNPVSSHKAAKSLLALLGKE